MRAEPLIDGVNLQPLDFGGRDVVAIRRGLQGEELVDCGHG